MSSNLSERLQQMIAAEAADRAVRVHVLLRKELPADETEQVANQIHSMAREDSLDFLPSMHALVGATSLGNVERIARLPQVFWIDVDSEASLEALLD